jgi:chromate reductase, NAD(P)H dehydrogenase (quinone)
MYTIVSGTNRHGSNTLKVAKEYQRLLKEKNIAANILSLEGLNLLTRDKAFEKIENEIIIPTDKFLFMVPEYNGSYPGILKLLFDTGKSHSIWWYKKALLTGVSTGKAGNVRGMEHFAGVLNYLKITICPNLLPVSVVDKLMDSDGRFTDENTIAVINNQLDQFISWYN